MVNGTDVECSQQTRVAPVGDEKKKAFCASVNVQLEEVFRQLELMIR